jgi:RimJ/RimL family protein N-acetyltransferase
MESAMTSLLSGTDELFAWMIGLKSHPTLSQPPGGVAPPEILMMLREAMKPVRAAHGYGDWLVLDGNEAVGLISIKRPADAEGTVEIGYGIAQSRWRRGYASHAVALVLAELARDPAIRTVTAETLPDGFASQRVLAKNGFVRAGRRTDAEDGDVICWRLPKLR